MPYVGYGDFKLYSHYNTVLNQLKGVDFSVITVGYNEEFIRVDIHNSLMLFFSNKNKKMFKITINVGAECLLNGVSVIGLHESVLYKLFRNLYYDDMEEVFETKQGVFFETDPITHCVISATVYIKEMDYGSFYDYKW